MSCLPIRTIGQLQKVYIALNVLCVSFMCFYLSSQLTDRRRICLGVIIALPIATPKENINSGKFVFATFVNCMSSCGLLGYSD